MRLAQDTVIGARDGGGPNGGHEDTPQRSTDIDLDLLVLAIDASA